MWSEDRGGSQRSSSKETGHQESPLVFLRIHDESKCCDAMLGELSLKAKHSNFIASNMFGACSIARELRQCVSSKKGGCSGKAKPLANGLMKSELMFLAPEEQEIPMY